MHISSRIPSLLVLCLFALTIVASGQSNNFTLGVEISESHVPLANSALQLDTTSLDFRPLISFTGGDWASEKSEATLTVLSVETTDTPSAELEALLEKIEGKSETNNAVDLSPTPNWDTELLHSTEITGTLGSYLLKATRENQVIYMRINQIDENQLHELLSGLALSQAEISADPFAQLPLSLNVPQDFPLNFTGKVPMLGYAFEGKDGTMIGLDDGTMMGDLLTLDEASLRSQVGETATIRFEGDDKLIFGYEQKDGSFQVFGIRAIEDQIVAMMGQGTHTESIEADLLRLLEMLEKR